MKKLSGLFVNHGKRVFGGERSLATFLRNCDVIDQELILPKSLNYNRLSSMNWQQLQMEYFIHAKKIKTFHLPYSKSYLGPDNTLKSHCKFLLKNLCWIKEKRFFYNYLKSQQFDFIHLNSFTLLSIITQHFPFIIHIREIVHPITEQIISKLKEACGIIFIDETVRSAFKDFSFENELILQNPIDMRHLNNIDALNLKEKMRIPKVATVFTMLGNFLDIKGIKECIQAFIKTKNANAIFLLVGPFQNSYGLECKKLAQNHSRVFFFNERYDVEKIYSISDYIIRGEPFFALGRTALEGLYGGCDVILPGSTDDINTLKQLTAFRDKIHMYPPRNEQALIKLLNQLLNQKVNKRKMISNVDEYVEKFHRFVLKCVGSN